MPKENIEIKARCSDLELVKIILDGKKKNKSKIHQIKILASEKDLRLKLYREIYFIGNIRFYLDKVRGLGNFIGIKTINFNGKIERKELLKQYNYYVDILGIKKEDVVTESYYDLFKKFVRTT